MDLLKAFDILNHNPLLCELKACGFDANTLTIMRSYFSNRQQRIWLIRLTNNKNSQ